MARATTSLVFSLFLGVAALSACSRQREVIKTGSGPRQRVIRPIDAPNIVRDARTLGRLKSLNASYYFLLGENLTEPSALAALERAKELDPDSSYLHLALAKKYLALNRPVEALAYAQKSLELDAKDKEAKMLVANLFASTKRVPEARTLLGELIREFPDDDEILVYSVVLEIEDKNAARAMVLLKNFLTRNVDSEIAHFYLGRIEQEEGKIKDAINHFEKAVAIRPGFVQAGTYLAFLYEATKREDDAIATYGWLAAQSDEVAFHKKLAELHGKRGNLEQAVNAFQNLERLEPQDQAHSMRLAMLQVELKNFPEALNRLTKLLTKLPDSEDLRFYRATVFDQTGRFVEAQSDLAKIPATSKYYPDAFRSRLLYLRRQDKITEAKAFLHGKLKTFPPAVAQANKEEVEEIAIQFLDDIKDKAEANELLESVLHLNPLAERFLYVKGSFLERDGKTSEAIDLMEQILARNPKHAGALNFIGYLWADQGKNLGLAESRIRAALLLRPQDPFIKDSLGWVLFKRGKYKESFASLREAHLMKPDESVILAHLGDVLVKLGRIGEALRYYEMALQAKPEKDSERATLEAKVAGLRRRETAQCLGGADCVAPQQLLNSRNPASSN